MIGLGSNNYLVTSMALESGAVRSSLLLFSVNCNMSSSGHPGKLLILLSLIFILLDDIIPAVYLE